MKIRAGGGSFRAGGGALGQEGGALGQQGAPPCYSSLWEILYRSSLHCREIASKDLLLTVCLHIKVHLSYQL